MFFCTLPVVLVFLKKSCSYFSISKLEGVEVKRGEVLKCQAWQGVLDALYMMIDVIDVNCHNAKKHNFPLRVKGIAEVSRPYVMNT